MSDSSSGPEPLLLNVSADTSKLLKSFEQLNARLDLAGVELPRKAKKAASGIEEAFAAPNIGKAFEKIFDSSRLKVFDTATERIGLTGSALESLGAVGLGAAAAIGVLGVALEGAHKADEYAAAISKAAQQLHVTTDQLQQYREATRLAGGETQGADEALGAFSVKLGEAQAGMQKAQRPFLELGFTPAQIKSFTDVDSALRAVTEKLSGLSGVQKDAVLQQMGLEGMKPLLEGGLDKMLELKQEAVSLGLVMDSGAIARGREMNEQFETMSQVINLELKQALVDLGPVLLDLLKGVAAIAGAFDNWVEASKAIGQRSSSNLAKQAKDDMATIAQLSAQRDRGGLFGGLDQFAQQRLDEAQKRLPQIQAELKKRALDAAQNAPAIPKTALTDPNAAAKAQKQAVEQQELAVRAKLDAANAAGDSAQAEALKDQVDLLGKVKAYMSAGLTQAEAEVAAGRDMALIEAARNEARREGVTLLQREALLKVAETAGDQAAVDQLQRESELEKLTAEYQKDGLSYEQAHAAATADVDQEQAAINAKRVKALADLHDQADLQVAQLTGATLLAESIQHRLDLEKLINEYKAEGLGQTQAEAAAAADLLKIDQARAAAKQKLAVQAQQEFDLSLAEASGDLAAVQKLQQAIDFQKRQEAFMAQGFDQASATDLATAQQTALLKAQNGMANTFASLDQTLSTMDGAFSSHNWAQLSASLAKAIQSLETAFGPQGTLGGRIGAVLSVANGLGAMIGGKAGGVLSGGAGGAMIGMQLGTLIPGIGNVAGAVLGGLGGAISDLFGNDKTRDIQAQQAAEAAWQQQMQATTTALQQLQKAQGDYDSALEAFYTASGQSQKALEQQRADELQGLDDATKAVKQQTFAWDDYNTAISAANDNVTSAQQALKSAYDAQSQALQALIDKFRQYQDTLGQLGDGLSPAGAGASNGQLAAARAAYQSTLALAQALDDNSLQAFPQAAQDYLAAAKANAHTGAEYQAALAQVKADASGLAGLAGGQADAQQSQLGLLQDQVSGLIQINDSVLGVAQAIDNLEAALTAKAGVAAPASSTPAASQPGGDYTSTKGDYVAYVQGQADLLQGYNDNLKNPVFWKTIAAAGLPQTEAGWGQFQWEHGGALQGRSVRPFARGGSGVLGGLAGVDTNLLSLNGNPIARVTAGELMTITPAGQIGAGGLSDAALQRLQIGIETMAARLASLDRRQFKLEKGGFPVRAVDASQPIQVQEVA